MRLSNRSHVHPSISLVVLALAATANSQTPSPLFPTGTIEHSGCYAPRCFESAAALDNGTAIAATRQLITVSIRGPVGWIKQQDIYNPDINPPRSYSEGERRSWPPFASAIGFSGDELLVAGSSSRYNFKDVVYVFSRANGAWSHTQTLAMQRPAAFDQTIVSHIAVDGDSALVTGTRYDDQDPTAEFMQIDFYVRVGPGQWRRRGSFKPPASSSDFFAESMDLDGNFALFGDPAAQGTGRAYLYEYAKGSWLLRRTFAAAAPTSDARFGSHVAIGGATAVVAAPGQPSENGYQRGAIHVFSRDAGAWQPARVVFEPTRETSPDPDDVRTFGTSLAIDGDRMIVGAQGGYFADFQPHAYLLEPRFGWTVVGQLINREALYSDRVFISGSSAIVEGAQEWGDRAGYVFELPLPGQLP